MYFIKLFYFNIHFFLVSGKGTYFIVLYTKVSTWAVFNPSKFP